MACNNFQDYNFINFSHSQQIPNTFAVYDERVLKHEERRNKMAQDIFRRYEKKYRITREQYQHLLSRTITGLIPEPYGKHTICNVYFDTEDFQMIRNSLAKPVYKEKLRLRSYGTPGNEDMVYLAYERIAFSGRENSDLRITFDMNIRARQHAAELGKGSYGTVLLDKGSLLMEVKIPGAMPVWMSRLFSELQIYPISFSKYGTYYQDYIAGNHKKQGGEICA